MFQGWPEHWMEKEAAFPPNYSAILLQPFSGHSRWLQQRPPNCLSLIISLGLHCFLLGSLLYLASPADRLKGGLGQEGPDSPRGAQVTTWPSMKQSSRLEVPDTFILTIITDSLWCFQLYDSVTL